MDYFKKLAAVMFDPDSSGLLIRQVNPRMQDILIHVE